MAVNCDTADRIDPDDLPPGGERRKHFCKMHDIRGIEIEHIQELIGNIPKILSWMNLSRGATIGVAFIATLLLALIMSNRTEVNTAIERHQAKVEAQTELFRSELNAQSSTLAIWKKVVEDNQINIAAERKEVRNSIKDLNDIVTELRLSTQQSNANKSGKR